MEEACVVCLAMVDRQLFAALCARNVHLDASNCPSSRQVVPTIDDVLQ
jgi:hypothetical protein